MQVLDDNKKLCLNSGEIIAMSASMSLMFEVADLAVASPATVSRCGMVYYEPSALGWAPMLDSWLPCVQDRLPPAAAAHLRMLFERFVPVSLQWVQREVSQATPVAASSLVSALIHLCTALLDELFPSESSETGSGPPRSAVALAALMERLFVFSITWSFGATSALSESRSQFDAFLRSASLSTLAEHTSPSGERYELPPQQGRAKCFTTWDLSMFPSVFDLTLTAAGDWATWDSQMQPSAIPQDAPFSSIVVDTVESARMERLLHLALRGKHPLLFVGSTGTGKTLYCRRALSALDAAVYAPTNFVCLSARTTANQAQYLVDSKVGKRRKGVFGPPVGKTQVVFIDDLNMPHVETYGAQPPIELLRQGQDQGGWYDRDGTFRNLQVRSLHSRSTLGGWLLALDISHECCMQRRDAIT